MPAGSWLSVLRNMLANILYNVWSDELWKCTFISEQSNFIEYWSDLFKDKWFSQHRLFHPSNDTLVQATCVCVLPQLQLCWLSVALLSLLNSPPTRPVPPVHPVKVSKQLSTAAGKLKMEEDLSFLVNVRQPQCFVDGRRPQFFINGRRPQFSL